MTNEMTAAAEILVLAYHRIGDPPEGDWNDWFYVADEEFSGHLDLLRSSGWTFIDLRRLLAGMAGESRLPARSVLITFDDADVTLLTGGLPHLAARGLPAVVFVPTNFIGGVNEFDHGQQPLNRICSWGELRELTRHGVAIQAHSASHCRFSDLGPAQVRRELQRSKDALEDRLGEPVEAFAYPFGDMGSHPAGTEAMLTDLGYRVAFLYGGRCPWPLAGSPRFRLARLALGRDTRLDLKLAPPNPAARPTIGVTTWTQSG